MEGPTAQLREPMACAAVASQWLALALFALCWGCTLTCSCLLVSIAPIAASLLGTSDTLAPFTCGSFLVRASPTFWPALLAELHRPNL